MKGSIVFSIILLIGLINIIECTSITAFRMLQTEKDGKIYGPQKFSLNSPIIYYNNNIETYSKKSVIIKENEVSIKLIKGLIQKQADGIIILTSSASDINRESQKSSIYKSIYDPSTSFDIYIPIYFIEESKFSMENNNEMKEEEDYRLVVTSTTTSNLISTGIGINYQGMLRGESKHILNKQIVIMASYDSFGYVPGQSTGKDASSSAGAIALLELARIFNKLYKNPMTIAEHNIIFVLTDASQLNYQGVKRWVSTHPEISLQSINFVLFLDGSIGNDDDNLFLQISRPQHKDASTDEIYQEFINASKENQITLELNQKKVNLSESAIYAWPHEPVSAAMKLSMSLTSRKSIDEQQQQKGININILKRNIKIIATALINHLYIHNTTSTTKLSKDIKLSDILVDSLDVNQRFLESWYGLFSSAITMSPYSVINDQSLPKPNIPSPIVTRSTQSSTTILHQSIESQFKDYLQDTIIDQFSLTGNVKYYSPIVAQMSFFKVKSILFDLVHLLLTISYLFLLYLILQGKSAMNEIKQFISSIISTASPSSKKKL